MHNIPFLLCTCRVRYAVILGTKYALSYIVLCYHEEEMPVFGKIKDIVVTPAQECLFILTPFVATTFNTHFHAFEVSPLTEETLIYHQRELADFHPLSTSKSFTTSSPMFVCTKYNVV